MSDQAGDRSVQRFFGLILMAVGALITGLSGLCTLSIVIIGIGNFIQAHAGPSGVGLILLALFIGAFPIAIGVGLVLGGQALRRPPIKPSSDLIQPTSFTEPD